MVEQAALGIDTIGHEWVRWMGFHFVFAFLFSVWMGVHASKALKKGQFMCATRLGIVSSKAKILFLLPPRFPFPRVHYIITQ